MGSKSGYLILVFAAFNLSLQAQTSMDFGYVDSLTYSYYLNGDWDKLISSGSEAIRNSIDYKFLRQRLGFAYFSKGDYSNAQRQFRKAYSFDSYDSFTQEYLYYSYLYAGQEEAAAMACRKMSSELRKSLSVNLFKPVESIAAEYNFKYAGTSLRSNPQYMLFGFSSRFGSRIGIYQMVSKYHQTITVQLPLRDSYVNDEQFEYYALVKASLASNLLLKTAYHYLNTTYSFSNTSSNLGYLGLSTISSNLLLGADFSLLSTDGEYIRQYGIQAGLNSIGSNRLYLIGKLSVVNESNSGRLVYSQRLGLKIKNWLWLEGNAIFGNQNNFSDYSSMYVYNSIDPTTFRAGSTAYFYAGKHLSLWISFAYERKQYYEDINYSYNQFSYLGGIRWKI